MQFLDEPNPCCCAPPPELTEDEPSKYFREIGTEMLGNHLIIRVERDKSKKKKKNVWEPPCDCIEIQRPSKNQGPKILNRGDDTNTILFQVKSKTQVNRGEENTGRERQSISYKVGACTGGRETNDQCRIITVHPQVEREGSQVVHSDHVTEGDQSVFFLRIKKKPDTIEDPKKHIELELRTPRPPTPPPPPPVLTPRKSKSAISLKKKKKRKSAGYGL